MFIGSGALWGETILFAMCILEEMQWKRTRYITSADFFHGTLELVEKDVPVFLFKGEDECRKLDERVEAFLTNFADQHQGRGRRGDRHRRVRHPRPRRRLPRHRSRRGSSPFS